MTTFLTTGKYWHLPLVGLKKNPSIQEYIVWIPNVHIWKSEQFVVCAYAPLSTGHCRKLGSSFDIGNGIGKTLPNDYNIQTTKWN